MGLGALSPTSVFAKWLSTCIACDFRSRRNAIKRLTFENKKKDPLLGKAFISCDLKDCILIDCAADAPCKKIQALIDRLFDIEEIIGNNYDLDRLRELVEADRDGRCVGLTERLHPCIPQICCPVGEPGEPGVPQKNSDKGVKLYEP